MRKLLSDSGAAAWILKRAADIGISTRQELSEALGMNRRTLYSRFRGQSAWRTDEIEELAELLHISDTEAWTVCRDQQEFNW